MIITLCGSNRFEPWFHLWNCLLTNSGHVVFSISSYGSFHRNDPLYCSIANKIQLDKIHFNKIELSHSILVLNKFGYIGESTLNEIAFAKGSGKAIYALESWGKGFGIYENHFESIQDSCKSYGVSFNASPLDTFAPFMKYPYDLLSTDKVVRQKMLKYIEVIETTYRIKK